MRVAGVPRRRSYPFLTIRAQYESLWSFSRRDSTARFFFFNCEYKPFGFKLLMHGTRLSIRNLILVLVLPFLQLQL